MLALVGSFPTHLRHYFPIGKPTKNKNKHNDVPGIGLFGFRRWIPPYPCERDQGGSYRNGLCFLINRCRCPQIQPRI